jgi:hypothetical protein
VCLFNPSCAARPLECRRVASVGTFPLPPAPNPSASGNFTQACHRTNLPFARRGPDIPGDLFRRSRNGKKMEGRLSGGRNSDRTNPDQAQDWTSSARPSRPKRNSSSQAVGRRRRRPRAKIVAGRAPKSSQAARQNAKSDLPAAVNLPRPIASPQGPRRGRASQTEAWKGMYSWTLCQVRGGDQVCRVRVQ